MLLCNGQNNDIIIMSYKLYCVQFFLRIIFNFLLLLFKQIIQVQYILCIYAPQYDNYIVSTYFQNIYLGFKCVTQSDNANLRTRLGVVYECT